MGNAGLFYKVMSALPSWMLVIIAFLLLGIIAFMLTE